MPARCTLVFVLVAIGCGGRSSPRRSPGDAREDARVEFDLGADDAAVDHNAPSDMSRQACTRHADCGETLVCVGVADGTVCELCSYDNTPCACGDPWGGPFPLVTCTRDADCQDLSCGEGCDDCPWPCPTCIHGWCVYPAGDFVNCVCDGCG